MRVSFIDEPQKRYLAMQVWQDVYRLYDFVMQNRMLFGFDLLF